MAPACVKSIDVMILPWRGHRGHDSRRAVIAAKPPPFRGSLDDRVAKDNPVRAITHFRGRLDLGKLGFTRLSRRSRGSTAQQLFGNTCPEIGGHDPELPSVRLLVASA